MIGTEMQMADGVTCQINDPAAYAVVGMRTSPM